MGRKKLVDYFREEDSEMPDYKNLDPQQKFLWYLEKRVRMIYKYSMKRWGIKPRGYLNSIQLSSVKTSWGEHYVLNIVFPHSLENYYKQLRGFIHYIQSIFPTPEMVSLKISPAKQGNEEVDLITIEAKYVMISIQNSVLS